MVSNAQKTLGGTGQGPDAEGAIETSFGGRTISEEIPDFAAPSRDGCACSTVCGACIGKDTQPVFTLQPHVLRPLRPKARRRIAGCLSTPGATPPTIGGGPTGRPPYP